MSEFFRVFESQPAIEAVKQRVRPIRLCWVGEHQSIAMEFRYGCDKEKAKIVAQTFLIAAYDAKAIKFWRNKDKADDLFYATFDWGENVKE